MSNKSSDILIVGAGPAGCTAALALKDAGLKVVLIDKSSFPRDKVCGDAIPARAIQTLKAIDSKFADVFKVYDKAQLIKHTDVVYNQKQLKLHWKLDAYTCPRLYFDNQLLGLVKKHTDTEILEGITLKTISKTEDGYALKDKDGITYNAKIVIGADGAQGICAKQLANYTVDRDHYLGAVRAYFDNVANTKEDTIEIIMDRRFLPGYFWIFPVSPTRSNVGFGMLSADIAKRKMDLKKGLYDVIEKIPELKSRFVQAKQIGKLEGHGLPIGSRKIQMSGEGFMLCGDAASLVDPITGEGIGNAMLSARLAALQAIQCIKTDSFSAQVMQQYDTAVWGALGDELKLRTKTQSIMSKMPFLLDWGFKLTGWEPVRRFVQSKC
ncbi:MAG: geranylgeranyl reductase family protein [Flavipsychrobacter sp.]